MTHDDLVMMMHDPTITRLPEPVTFYYRSYTHQDGNGLLWRLSGSRPTCELADLSLMGQKYILQDGKITPVSLLVWAHWFDETENRQIAYTVVEGIGAVSTVFWGIDMNLSGEGKALLFETQIFMEDTEHVLHGGVARHATLGEAKNGHCLIVEKLESLR